MKNSDKFLEFFSAIEKQLKKITHLDSKSSFYQFVENPMCQGRCRLN
jgi:hypothetical protein